MGGGLIQNFKEKTFELKKNCFMAGQCKNTFFDQKSPQHPEVGVFGLHAKRGALLLEALMKLVQLQWKSFLNKNLPSLMIYVHTNQCQLFHISNGII